MKKALLPLLLGLVIMFLLAACGSSEAETEEEHLDDDDHALAEMDHEHVDPPDEFASLTNPFEGDHEAIEAGEVIFQTNCATCHGPEGQGDGPAAEGLDPKPAKLADGAMMGMLSDGYVFWRVSKGGAMEPFNSAMPSWEAAFSEEERWQVISFVRTLADGGGEHMDEGEHVDENEHSD